MDEKMRVMVVDDEKIVRESLFFWFEKAGYAVETASSGFEALKKKETYAVEVMFEDSKMPGMDGITLLE